MSFGRRLILFFLLIVVLPMLAVAGLLLQVTGESRTGKADARLAAGIDVALNLVEEAQVEAMPVASRLAKDRRLAAALRAKRPAAEQALADRLAGESGAAAVSIEGVTGSTPARAGEPAVGFARVQLKERDALLGTLNVSVTSAADYIARVKELTGRDAVLIADTEVVAGSRELPPGSAPPVGDTDEVEVEGEELRARTVGLDSESSLVMIGPSAGDSLPTIDAGVAFLLAFLLAAALVLTFFLARTMQGLHEMVSQQAVTDDLTGLSNQRRFRELLGKETERARRFKHDLSLLMLDLDDFKRVNDTYGHLQGDDVLRAVAAAVRDESRGVDEPSRYGGEELAVALPETDTAGAMGMAERVRARIEDLKITRRGGRDSIGVTVSIGVASLGGSVDTAEALVAAADSALYEAKRAGKNRACAANGDEKGAASAYPVPESGPRNMPK